MKVREQRLISVSLGGKSRKNDFHLYRKRWVWNQNETSDIWCQRHTRSHSQNEDTSVGKFQLIPIRTYYSHKMANRAKKCQLHAELRFVLASVVGTK